MPPHLLCGPLPYQPANQRNEHRDVLQHWRESTCKSEQIDRSCSQRAPRLWLTFNQEVLILTICDWTGTRLTFSTAFSTQGIQATGSSILSEGHKAYFRRILDPEECNQDYCSVVCKSDDVPGSRLTGCAPPDAQHSGDTTVWLFSLGRERNAAVSRLTDCAPPDVQHSGDTSIWHICLAREKFLRELTYGS